MKCRWQKWDFQVAKNLVSIANPLKHNQRLACMQMNFECFISAAHKYKIMTHTGDVRGAGTDANVHITLFGDGGDTGQHKLSNKWKNNFQRKR